MHALLHMVLSNALIVGVLSASVLPLARWAGKPALTHALCVLLLVKLFTPPLVNLPIWTRHMPSKSVSSVAHAPERHAAKLGIPLTGSIATVAPDSGATSQDGLIAIIQEERDATTKVSSQPPVEVATSKSIAAPVMAPRTALVPSTIVAPPASSRWMILRTMAQDHWRQWLFIAWFATAFAMGVIMVLRILRLRRALDRAVVQGPPVLAELNLLAGRLGVNKLPDVQFVSASISPMLVALLGRPRLVIPIDLWERLDVPRRRALLLHELAHLRRGDHWVRYLESLCTCLYWWNPAVWLVRAMLRDAEEQCCDAWVVWAMPGSSRTYMSTLLDAVDFLSQSLAPRELATPVLASGMGQFHRLHRRLIMVREQKVQRRLGLWGFLGVALVSAAALPLGAVMVRADDNAPATTPPETKNTITGTVSVGTTPVPVEAPPPAPAAETTPANVLPPGGPGGGATLPAATEPPRPLPGVGGAPPVPGVRAGSGIVLVAPAAPEMPADPKRNFTPAIVGGASSDDPHDLLKIEEMRIEQLKAELAAAQANVARLQHVLDAANSHAGLPHLGHIVFSYQPVNGKNQLMAFDRTTMKLMWTFDVPLNDKSVVQCHDNETILVRAADGAVYLLNAESGSVNQSFPPGAPAPQVKPNDGINPFGAQRGVAQYGVEPAPAGTMGAGLAPRSDGRAVTLRIIPNGDGVAVGTVPGEEERMRRMEDNIAALTKAVERLTEQQNHVAQPELQTR